MKIFSCPHVFLLFPSNNHGLHRGLEDTAGSNERGAKLHLRSILQLAMNKKFELS